MKAVIVPGVTDLNKGDQALVWESHRLVKDTNLFDDIYILTNGDTPEEAADLCGQSQKRGFGFINNILKHPRRGRHKTNEVTKESFFSLLSLLSFAFYDLVRNYILLLVCNNNKLTRLLFSRSTHESIKQFKNCDVFFVKGGGFIHAYGEKTAPYLMWYFLFYIRLAKKLKKKVVFLPNSFGPFKGFTVKYQVKKVLSKVDLLYARENISAQALGALLEREIPVRMDLGFFLQVSNDVSIENIIDKYDLCPEDRLVGVTIRPWRFPGKHNPEHLYKNYLYAIECMINQAISLNYKIVFCNQSIGPNEHEDDRNAIKAIFEKINHPHLIWINENLTCEELKLLYSKFDLFVGTRFHSVIFSMTSLVPSIAIAYGGNKGEGIMGDFNLQEYVIKIEEITSDKLLQTFKHVISNNELVKDKLTGNVSKIEFSRNKMIDEIKHVVND